MWIFAALERAHRFHGPSAKRWRESKKQCNREREHDDEPQLPPAEIENQAHWILRHVKHRHNQWRRPPGEHQSERRGRDASNALSTSTSWIRRHCPAPIETRNAISLVRAAAWAVSRLPTLAQATSSTRATSTARMSKGRRYSFCISDAPEPAGKRRTFSLR